MKRLDFRIGIRRSAEGERKYIRRLNGQGHFAHLKLRLELQPAASCHVMRAAALPIPEPCLEAARSNLIRIMTGGDGQFPLHGIAVTIAGGSWHEKYSNPEAFAIAAEMALEDGLRSAGRMVLEPWVRIRMQVKDEALATFMRGLTKLFSDVRADISWNRFFIVQTEVPLHAVEGVKQLGEAEVFSLPLSTRYREVPPRPQREWSGQLDSWT